MRHERAGIRQMILDETRDSIPGAVRQPELVQDFVDSFAVHRAPTLLIIVSVFVQIEATRRGPPRLFANSHRNSLRGARAYWVDSF